MSKIKVNEISTLTGTDITITAGKTLTGTASQFKITGGTATQALITDGSGGLSFADVTSDPTMGGDLTGTASNAQIAAGAVDTAEIATDAVTANKIIANAVGVAELNVTDGTVGQALLTDGSGGLSFGTVAADFSTMETNLAIVAFHSATTAAKYFMEDQVIDNFGDTTGIDTTNSTGEGRDLAGYMSGVISVPGNHFGDGTLGTCQFLTSGIAQSSNTTDIDTVLTTGSVSSGPGDNSYGGHSGTSGGAPTSQSHTNVPNCTACYEFTVPAKNTAYDGDMTVLNFKDLNIEADVTLTVDQPCRGMLVYVDGDCIINGALSMTSRGAFADPSGTASSDAASVHALGLQMPIKKTGETDILAAAVFAGTGTPAVTALANHPAIGTAPTNYAGKTYTIVKVGGAGGPRAATGSNSDVTTPGGNIANGTGGGGGGGSHDGGILNQDGSAGTCFSGGSAGGGSRGGSSGSVGSYGPQDFGGRGGYAGSQIPGAPGSTDSGGAGNPGGNGHNNWGGDGTGGLLILMVSGTLTIGTNGKICADGEMTGGNGSGDGNGEGGGGSSGGGRLIIGHVGSFTGAAGKATALGAVTHGDPASFSGFGGTGGDGAVDFDAIDSASTTSAGDMTLISNTFTAESTATSADLILHIEDMYANTVIGTDLKAYVSRNGNSDWSSELTLTTEVDLGSNQKILVAKGIDLTSLAGTTSMRYKLVSTGQVLASKETRIHAVSLAWNP